MYYRYYHDPGHHNTRAHYGIRTSTHKLIYYWKKDAYEMFDLVEDPNEQRNLLDAPKSEVRSVIASKFEELKLQLQHLQQEYGDDGLYADSESWPKGSADGPFGDRISLGTVSITKAMLMAK
jgi:hypothetical protein